MISFEQRPAIGCGWVCEPRFGPDSQVLVLNPEAEHWWDDEMTTLGRFRPTAVNVSIMRAGHCVKREILLIRRAKEPGKNQWSFPGGKRFPLLRTSYLSEPPFATGIRETAEELGIDLRENDFGPIILGFRYPKTGHRVVVLDAFLDWDDLRKDVQPRPNSEITEARWVSAETVKSLRLTDFAKEALPFFFS